MEKCYSVILSYGKGEKEKTIEMSVAEGYGDRADVRAKAYEKAFLAFMLEHKDQTVMHCPHFRLEERHGDICETIRVGGP